MTRLLVFWTRPQHLSDGEADAWVLQETRRVTAVEGVCGARLTRLRPATERHPSPADWMLELQLTPGADQRDCIDAPICAEWLADLALLGMQPAVVVTDEALALDQAAR